MKRSLALLAGALLAVAETYRRGYGAPLVYGCRCWVAVLDPRPSPATESDYMA